MKILTVSLAVLITALFIHPAQVKAQTKKATSGHVDDEMPLVFSETFDKAERIPSANTGEVKFKSGPWLLTDAEVGLNPHPKTNDDKAIRIVNKGKLSMRFDVMANKRLTIEMDNITADKEQASDWEVLGSLDHGASYHVMGVKKDNSKRSTRCVFVLNYTGKVRFEIRKLSGGKNSLWIDGIEIRTLKK